jgi:hypothetical protein
MQNSYGDHRNFDSVFQLNFSEVEQDLLHNASSLSKGNLRGGGGPPPQVPKPKIPL